MPPEGPAVGPGSQFLADPPSVQTLLFVAWSLKSSAVTELLSSGSESVQREELPHHERPREDAECAGLPGELHVLHCGTFVLRPSQRRAACSS